MIKRLLSLVGLVFWINLFFDAGWNAMMILIFTVGLVAWVWFAVLQSRNWRHAWGWGIVVVLFAGAAFRVSPINQFLAWLGIVGTGVVLAYLALVELTVVRNMVELVMMPIRLGLGYLESGLRFVVGIFDWKPQGKMPQNLVKTIVVGGIFGLVAVVLIGQLLTSGDPVFHSFTGNLLALKISDQLLARLIVSAIAIALAIPVLFLKLAKKYTSPFGIWQRVVGESEATIGVSMVVILFGLFLVIQWPYIFASVPAETSLIQFGVATYSEYVRRGFGELIMAGIVGYAVAGLAYISSRGGKWLRVAQLVLLGELGLFAVSILRRLWLYQELHGLSLIRMYGSVVVVWMLFMLGMLAVRQFVKWRWVVVELAVSLLAVVGVVWVNAENLVISHPPTVNGQVDYVYLSHMSGDGVEGWIMAYAHAKNFLSDTTMQKVLLDSDDRRELVYANMIVRNLTANYQELLATYGTKAQYAEYLTAVQDEQERHRRLWQALPEPIRKRSVYDTPFQAITPPCVSVYQGVLDEFNGWPVEFYFKYCGDEDTRFRIAHFGGRAVFDRLTSAVSIRELHDLQERVISLYYRVYLQPQNEQGVQLDRDIQTRSFLGY